MVLTPSGEVLTNNHVIRGATVIRVRVPETGRTFGARVLGYSVSADVALLKLRGASGLETVALGDSSNVRIGQSVAAVGNAGGAGLTTKQGSITAVRQTIRVSDGHGGTARLTRLIQTDADLRPGDSGGPMFDGAGRVVGVNTAATVELSFHSGGSDGYATPINRARSIVSQIEAERSSAAVHVGATPFLGVTVEGPNDVVTRGVLVAGVKAGSPAAHAGVEPGDLISALNGHAVRSSTGLIALLLRWHPGDKIRVAWRDELGSRESATLTLASGPPQ
jgi:S1-C subfamily serine protease